MSASNDQHLVALIRRLASDGARLYVRIDPADIARLGLTHGQRVDLALEEGVHVSGIVKTSGSSPWLAPGPEDSNESITATLRAAGYEHGDDVLAVIRTPVLPGVAPAEATADSSSPAPQPSTRRPALEDTFRVDSETAIRAVQMYNAGRYRGQANVDIDRLAYDRFRPGLPEDEALLIDLVRFVGEDYGGAQRRFLPHGYREEAALIVARLIPVLGRWRDLVTSAPPLADGVPDEATLGFLFAPFAGTKRWPVWASKTLHFLRPDAFPILDSRAKNALGLRSLGSTPRDYQRYCLAFHRALVASRAALDAARSIDGGAAPSDLKLLDKILFQLSS